MLKELTKIKTEKGELSSVHVLHKKEETDNTCSSNLETTSDEEIDKLEKSFDKLQRITNKNQTQPVSQKIGILGLQLWIYNLKKEIFSTNSRCLLINFMNGTLIDFLNRKFLINLAPFLCLLTVT